MVRLNELYSLIFYLSVAVICLLLDYITDHYIFFLVAFFSGLVAFAHLAIICVRIFFGNDKYNINE